MTYKRQLPQAHYLLRLAKSVEFPESRDDLIRAAEKGGYPESMKRFLKLFAAYDTFEGCADFVNRCEELELLIRQEREAPKEYLHSQQD